jgi:hypothetical protein
MLIFEIKRKNLIFASMKPACKSCAKAYEFEAGSM